MTIETFQTAGTLTDPQPPKWVAVIRDANDTVLASSGEHGSEQDAIGDVTSKYDDLA